MAWPFGTSVPENLQEFVKLLAEKGYPVKHLKSKLAPQVEYLERQAEGNTLTVVIPPDSMSTECSLTILLMCRICDKLDIPKEKFGIEIGK